MSIASLVFTQSLYEISPVKRVVLQCFQTPHKCFYSYLADSQQSFQKIPKDQPHSPCPQASSGCPTGGKKNPKKTHIFCRDLSGSSWFTLSLSVKARWQSCLGREQPGACILPQCRNKWGGRQKSCITNITFRDGNNWNVSTAGKKKSYLCSSFLIFKGKISINHYPQACCGI